ncbi:14458_t:CDS:10 [Acaulospora morrowiae]|uniref:Ubiquitin carboxyl-terminal hydrolase n=1 Tax=Acaulospora morrowiae TaxID=94023 RepID=A0A9N9FH70_9GLOM|nr:14458_t:CDS:10 [Acaulospora morrowiae]
MSSLILSHKERAEGPWVKLQSEPSLFTTLMYDLGVKGARATEVFVLDQQDNFDDLGEIYGLVFLFKMTDALNDTKGLYNEDESLEDYPPNVYFANQVVENACATLAVLNIALNCRHLEIGKELREFKEFSWDLPPAARGSSIANHPTFRQIHNSMARHPEDSLIVEEIGKKKGDPDEEGGEVYHYIAYVPIDGEVWQLDGLYPRPIKIGNYEDEKIWYDAARGVINERIDRFHAEQVEYVLLAITKDQISIHQDRVKDCLYIKKFAERRLDELSKTWRETNIDDIETTLTEDDELKVLDRANIDIEIENLTMNFDDIEKIEQIRAKVVNEIKFLLEAIDREIKLKEVEKERRTFDYGPFIREFISILHERGELKELLANADYMEEGDE